MSTVTGNSAAYHASVEAPDDGDERDAAAFLVVAEAAMDNTAFLYARVTGGSEGINTGYINASGNADIAGSAHVGGSLTVDVDVNIGDDLTVTDDVSIGGSVTVAGGATVVDVDASGYVSAAGGFFRPSAEEVTRVVDSGGETSGGWEVLLLGNDYHWVTNTSFERRIRIPLNAVVPRNASITQIVATFQAMSGHAALPANKAQLILYRKRVGTSGAASGIVDSASDPSGSTAAYEAEHDIPLVLGAPHTATTDTHSYYAVMVSEFDGGGNAISGAVLFGLKVTYTYTRVDPI